MYEDCPDHGLPGLSVCDRCVRPLCRKCKATRSRCAECRAADRQDSSSHVPGRSAAGNGSVGLVLVLIVLVTLALTWKGCPGLPHDIVWLK